MSSDTVGFNLQEVVKTKRVKQEIRQEDISEWLAELEAVKEEVKPEVDCKLSKVGNTLKGVFVRGKEICFSRNDLKASTLIAPELVSATTSSSTCHLCWRKLW